MLLNHSQKKAIIDALRIAGKHYLVKRDEFINQKEAKGVEITSELLSEVSELQELIQSVETVEIK